VLLVLCLCFICRTYKSIMMEIEEMEASSTSSKQNSRRKKERERIRAKRAKMTPEEKDKARADNTKKERERIRAKRAKMTPEEQDKARADNTKAREQKRAKMTPEEQDKARADNTKAREQKRAKMTPEEQDKARADNTKAREQKRAKMTPEEKDKARAKVKEANIKKQKKKEEFCRGFISDEERELHTVWILDKEKDGKYGPVAKLMFSEEVFEEDEGQGGRQKFYRGKSKFVLVKSKPDEDDKKFVEKQIELGKFVFRHNRKKHGYGQKQKLYFRFGATMSGLSSAV